VPDGRFASQAAADLAAELGLLDVQIDGTGTGGKVTVEDVRAVAPPDPPDDLAAAGSDLWRAVMAEWTLRPDQDRLLAAACRTADEIDRMETALADADPVVTGSKGQVRPHPLIGEVRQHRLALKQLLHGLGIEDADEGDGSTAGRKLARARWDRG
jgi:pyruvate/2-oxoglutarate dehydrogenase complex dihydrolipoamide acyltransferase (E2) component